MNINDAKITMPVFEFVFNGAESITHYPKPVDNKLYALLPNLYVVCLKDGARKTDKIVGGIIVKTTLNHSNESDFINVLMGLISESDQLNKFVGNSLSFLPAKLGVSSDVFLTENEVIHIAQTQYLKHSSYGSA